MIALKCENCGANLNTDKGTGGAIVCEYCGVTNLVGAKNMVYIQTNKHQFLLWLLKALRESMNLNEVSEVCHQLFMRTGNYAFDYDNIAGNTKDSKTRELVMACDHHMALSELVTVLISRSRKFALMLEAYDG